MANFDAQQLMPSDLGWGQATAAEIPGQQLFALFVEPPEPDTVAPAISALSPPVGSTIATLQPVTFQATDDSGAFRRIMVLAYFARTGIEEVVHDGDTFRGLYFTTSQRTAIVNGFEFSVLRAGGWPSSPTIRIFAVDQSGNEASG